jgi:hypothetical protein
MFPLSELLIRASFNHSRNQEISASMRGKKGFISTAYTVILTFNNMTYQISDTWSLSSYHLNSSNGTRLLDLTIVSIVKEYIAVIPRALLDITDEKTCFSAH